MSIFVGTTNEDCYLRDNTGARRFWPIRCGALDLARIERDREQLFAEAVARFKAGETWYQMPHVETEAEQEDRRQADEWENNISEFIFGKESTTITEVGVSLGLGTEDLSMLEQRRISGCLRKLGWDRRSIRSGGTIKKLWMPKAVNRLDSAPMQQDLLEDPY